MSKEGETPETENRVVRHAVEEKSKPNGEITRLEGEKQPFLIGPTEKADENDGTPKGNSIQLEPLPELLKKGLELGAKRSKLSRAFNLIQNNSITLRNLIIAVSTYGLERLLHSQVFSCPENGHEKYGFAYLLAPVFILFCVNLIAIGEVWKLSSRMYIKRYGRRGDCVARVLPSLLKSSVGPAVWLIISLHDGDYFACATVGPIPVANNLTSAEEIEDTRRKIETCKSQSILLSWVVLVFIVFLGTAMIVWKHCFLKDNLLMKNLYEFERREALSAMKTFMKYMKGDRSSSDENPVLSEYGRKDERVKLYEEGIPEIIGRKTVEKLFEDCHGDNWSDGHSWHYVSAYKAFREMYPRIATGSPLDPWRVVLGDVNGKETQKTCRFKWVPTCFAMNSSWGELQPLNLNDVNPNMKIDSETEVIESRV